MANVLTLTTPLMKQTVGFDRLNDLFEQLLVDKNDNYEGYPPYNIEKFGEDKYQITMAVAGFRMDDLEIMLHDGELKVSGCIQEKENEEEGHTFLHRGIATRSFQRIFRLADYIKVTDAEMRDGLLTIHLEREVPEEKRPRMIPIKTNEPNSKAIEDKSSRK